MMVYLIDKMGDSAMKSCNHYIFAFLRPDHSYCNKRGAYLRIADLIGENNAAMV